MATERTVAGAKKAARGFFQERRRLVLIPMVLVGLSFAFALYPSFPRAANPVLPADAASEGRRLLNAALDAHGGMPAFSALGNVSGALDDHYSALFEGFAVWPAGSTRAETVMAPYERGYKVRFRFADGSMWGFNGKDTWDYDGEGVVPDSQMFYRARHAVVTVPRMLFLPFSIAHEAAEVTAYSVGKDDKDAFDVVEAHFDNPARGGVKDRWLVFLDAASHRVTAVTFESTITDPPLIQTCFVDGRETVEGLTLVSWYTCRTASRLKPSLHRLLFEKIAFDPALTDKAFEPPRSIAPVAPDKQE